MDDVKEGRNTIAIERQGHVFEVQLLTLRNFVLFVIKAQGCSFVKRIALAFVP